MGLRLNSHSIRKAIYAPVLALAMAIIFGRLLVLAKILNVAAFAELSAMLIVAGIVGMLASFGLFLDFQRKLPGQLVRGQRRLAATYMWQAIMGALAVGLLGVLLAGLQPGYGGLTSDVIVIGVIHGVCNQLFLIVTTESRSNNEPLRFSLQSLSRSLALLAFGIPAAYWFQSAKAAILFECIATIAVILAIYLRIATRLPVGGCSAILLAFRYFRYMKGRATGTLLLLSIAGACSTQLDRWLSSGYLNSAEFAQYSFAWIILTVSFAVQGLVNASVFPQIAIRSAIGGARSAFRLAASVAFGMLGFFLLGIIPAVYFTDYAITAFYPDYTPAIPLIPVLAIAAAFRISDFWSGFLVISHREGISLAVNVFINVVAVGLWMSTRFGTNSASLSLAYLAAFSAVGTYLLSSLFAYWHRTRAA